MTTVDQNSLKKLHITCTPEAIAHLFSLEASRLILDKNNSKTYQVAQLDDYKSLKRKNFPHRPPLSISLSIRASQPDLPGTWGMGLWNDPFSLSLALGGGMRNLPVLPNTTWFFYASPQNYLSFCNDLPAQGWFVSAFRSPKIPSLLLAPVALCIPLLYWRSLAKLLRKLASKLIIQDACSIPHDPTVWHTYRIEWKKTETVYFVDDQHIFTSPVSPHGPLGLVIWVDNQFAAFTPEGALKFGALPILNNHWVEFRDLKLTPL